MALLYSGYMAKTHDRLNRFSTRDPSKHQAVPWEIYLTLPLDLQLKTTSSCVTVNLSADAKISRIKHYSSILILISSAVHFLIQMLVYVFWARSDDVPSLRPTRCGRCYVMLLKMQKHGLKTNLSSDRTFYLWVVTFRWCVLMIYIMLTGLCKRKWISFLS